MKQEMLILLAAVTLSMAMVPRLRRAVNSDEDDFKTASPPSNIVQICMPRTPCAWSVYKPKTKIVDTKIDNLYCVCSDDTVCIADEDDTTVVDASIHHCRKPTDHDENRENTEITENAES